MKFMEILFEMGDCAGKVQRPDFIPFSDNSGIRLYNIQMQLSDFH